jgi:hypothetical protein
MNKFIAVLVTAFLALIIGQASASTRYSFGQSVDTLNSSFICEKEKKKKKKTDDLPEETEPECD